MVKLRLKYIDGIPKEFEIKCGDKRSKRRIFYDRGYFFRNFSRSEHVSINEINSKISNSNITNQELLTVLIGMVRISDRKASLKMRIGKIISLTEKNVLE